MARKLETALVLVLEDAAPFDDVRREFAPDTVAKGIPFHITLLYPFAPRDELTEPLVSDTRSFLAEREPFRFALTRIETFPPAVVYAAPEPGRPLLDCTLALHERFPDWPPYGGVFAEPIPHATLAEDVDAERVRSELERRVGPHLPRDFTVETATLLEEFAPDSWRERERFPLGG